MTRAEKVAAKKAAWLATPIAYIEKPLKYIDSKVNSYDPVEKKAIISPIYTVARRHAKRGDGITVQKIAMSLATMGALA